MDLAIDKFDPQRFGLITGSKCSVLFPKRSAEIGLNTYARELANQLFFKFYDEQSTWQTEHGNMNEHEAFEYYKMNHDKKIEKGFFKKNGDFAGTCDAICDEYGIDFKCPTSLKSYTDYLFDGIDDQQRNQAQMYMYIFERPTWKVCVYLTETLRMGEVGLVYPVDTPDRMIIFDVSVDMEWQDRLKVVAPRLVELRDNYLNKLKEKFKLKEKIKQL